jgi:hypothetical protein
VGTANSFSTASVAAKSKQVPSNAVSSNPNASQPGTTPATSLTAVASNNTLRGCPLSRARAWDNAEAVGTAAPGATAGTTRDSTES